jgi:hypothetical protein
MKISKLLEENSEDIMKVESKLKEVEVKVKSPEKKSLISQLSQPQFDLNVVPMSLSSSTGSSSQTPLFVPSQNALAAKAVPTSSTICDEIENQAFLGTISATLNELFTQAYVAPKQINGMIFCDGLTRLVEFPTVIVEKWLDYSTKYGLGYQLSNGSMGAHFNDSSKIFFSPDEKVIDYIEISKNEKGVKTNDKISITAGTEAQYVSNHQLKKKITLLNYFKNYLQNNSILKGADSGGLDVALKPCKIEGKYYVVRWWKTKHAIVFCLNNGVMQVSLKFVSNQ